MDSVALGNILYIGRALSNYRRQLRPDDALMPSEILFISYIHRHQGCTQDQIVKASGMDKTTVAHRLNRLEEMGYVRREVSAKDARRRLCYPTPKAEDIYPEIHKQYVEFKSRILGEFTEEELAVLDRMTTRMKENAEGIITEYEKKPERKIRR